MSDPTREVHLPADLCTAAEQKFSNRFGTIEELLVAMLREILKDDAAVLDQNEQRVIEERLRELGYI